MTATSPSSPRSLPRGGTRASGRRRTAEVDYPGVSFGLFSRQRGYPVQLIAAALVLPVLLLAALVALDYWVLEPSFSSGLGHLALLVVGAAGVLTFSVVILARLGQLQAQAIAQ